MTDSLEPHSIISRFYDKLTKLRDPYESHHAHQVAALTVFLAEANGVDATTMIILKRGAHMHDIGKLVIPEILINKPGRLSEPDLAQVKAHSNFGYELANAMKLGPIIEDIILHHHENFDGSGYPEGLIGFKTSLYARIVHVADAFDALTQIRSYRPAYTPKEAIAIMQNEEHKFDPALLLLLRRKVTDWTTTLSR